MYKDDASNLFVVNIIFIVGGALKDAKKVSKEFHVLNESLESQCLPLMKRRLHTDAFIHFVVERGEYDRLLPY